MLAARGYCVIAIDSRGSQHRGLTFESHLRCKMGTVELSDQVEVLQWLSENLNYIDMDRIAIHGWSYGMNADMNSSSSKYLLYLYVCNLVYFRRLFKLNGINTLSQYI